MADKTVSNPKNFVEIQSKLLATRECVTALNDVKVNIGKNKTCSADAPR